ncbi:MAG: hydantoinase B/oxoprolinase family protein [Myxococcota bacterium]
MTADTGANAPPSGEALRAVDLAVFSNRLDGIVREMENTLLRTARSSVIGLARDFSCSIVTGDALLASAEGLPVHVYGSGLLARSLRRHHPNPRPGDAYLHNDPYDGNTHAADHSLLVPVFIDGEHLFTAIAKAHQADIGNAQPTTYMPTASDVYAEGALIFPCVQIQRDHRDVDDIVRMCRRRIRVPEVWYGDYLAMLAAGRIAERRLVELCGRFGSERVRSFIRDWFDYTERRARRAIRALPAGTTRVETRLDPYPGLEDGLALRATIEVDHEAGRIRADLRDNPDCVPIGLNLTEATAKNAVVAAMLMVMNSRSDGVDARVPLNGGSFRCFEVAVRENCVAGIPRHPASCSLATGEVGVRLWAAITAAFAEASEGLGAAEAGFGAPPYLAVVSGEDPARGPYVTQLLLGTTGGPATAACDGWLSFLGMPAAGLLYRDSVEVDEQKYPMIVYRSMLRPDSEGAGRRRGAPGNVCEYGPRAGEMQVFWSLEGVENPPKGVRGGQSPTVGSAYHVEAIPFGAPSVVREHPDAVGALRLLPGERVGSRSPGGGGYGDPLAREPERVLWDVREGYVSLERAAATYGVVITGDPTRIETLAIDAAATRAVRARSASARGS